MGQYVQSNVPQQVLEILSKLLVSEYVIVFVLQNLLDSLDIVLFVSST